ncbi:hypothetical protein, partial [Prevotella sp. MGM1]|uniref:hypothetical protein n=1 Tax=Prevotella sp. MGM1 TaxID=2033405 RepID=UPI001304DA00
ATGSSDSRWRANAMATAIFPQPRGPQSIMAWGKRFSAHKRISRPQVSPCPITSSKLIVIIPFYMSHSLFPAFCVIRR